MKFKSKEKALGIAAFALLFLPFLFFRKSHNCHYNDCIKIYRDGDLGLCIENAIDNACLVLIIIWYLLVIGSAMVREFQYVKAVMVLLVGVFFALLDPGKWMFAISFTPSLILCVILFGLDRNNRRKVN